MEFFHVLKEFMSQFKNRFILLMLGYGLGGWAAYYFWRLTLLLPDGNKGNFIFKVWHFYMSTDQSGGFFGFLIMFFIGWLLALVAIIYECVFIYKEWDENGSLPNFLRTVCILGLFLGVFYFFIKFLLIILACIVLVLLIGFVLSIFLGTR